MNTEYAYLQQNNIVC